LPESAIGELLESQTDYRFIIQPDMRQTEVRHRIADVDRGQFHLPDRLAHLMILDPGQNAVPVPVAKPLGRRHLEAVRLEIDRPGADVAQVMDCSSAMGPLRWAIPLGSDDKARLTVQP
jgi:hypothetical protein